MQIIVDDNNPAWGRGYITVTVPVENNHPAFQTLDFAQRGSHRHSVTTLASAA